ncbi:hypothetical protein MATL_G00200830 [Megalops atlanticus]|uniref:Uncharacterized protein n=1 Tax=Megalops atlanticus TaxID=7932 RepID=A0A9D3PHN0_MEGAT|nr:hypothetical protein MATL_G00200830 [Megalops atlanticus]
MAAPLHCGAQPLAYKQQISCVYLAVDFCQIKKCVIDHTRRGPTNKTPKDYVDVLSVRGKSGKFHCGWKRSNVKPISKCEKMRDSMPESPVNDWNDNE